MLYSVLYKPVNGFFWFKLKDIESDWIMDTLGIPILPKRHFLDKNKNCYELSICDTIVVFKNGRPNPTIPKGHKFNVWYSKPHSLFYKKIKNVIAETIMYEKGENPIKVLITEEGNRWEIPMKHFKFKVSKERLLAIQDQMEIEIGQVINAIK